MRRRHWWAPAGCFWAHHQSQFTLLWAFSVKLLPSPRMWTAWSPGLNCFLCEIAISSVVLCVSCLLPSCCIAPRTGRIFFICRLWQSPLHPLQVAGTPIWDAFCSLMDEGSIHSKNLGMKWMKQDNMLSCAGRDTVSYYYAQTKKEYFPIIFSVCHLFLPDSQGIFLVFCNTYEVGVSNHTLTQGLLWPCPPLPFTSFFAFPGLSLAFTQEISLKHQEAC